MKKKMIFLIVASIVIIVIGGMVFQVSHKTNVKETKISAVKKEKTSNYTINYALKHYDSYEDFLDDNHSIQWALSEKTYVLKGDGSSKHAGGWTFKEGKGNMIQSGHERGKIDYIVTTDNKDVTTIGAIKKAFSEKNN